MSVFVVAFDPKWSLIVTHPDGRRIVITAESSYGHRFDPNDIVHRFLNSLPKEVVRDIAAGESVEIPLEQVPEEIQKLNFKKPVPSLLETLIKGIIS